METTRIEDATIAAAIVAWGNVRLDALDLETLRAFERAAGRLTELQRLAAGRMNLALAEHVRASAREVLDIFRALPGGTCTGGQVAA